MVDFKITWIDGNREPQMPPDPKYPKGIDIDVSFDRPKTCASELPYPAKRCGQYIIECLKCGQRIVLSTAGRPDDPRSIKMACRVNIQ